MENNDNVRLLRPPRETLFKNDTSACLGATAAQIIKIFCFYFLINNFDRIHNEITIESVLTFEELEYN